MPMAPSSPCRAPGCPNPGKFRGYCADHRGLRRKGTKERPGTKARGYGGRWPKVSKLYRKLHPLCEHCEAEGRVTAGELVDHIIPVRAGGARLAFGNLQTLCRPCHGKKTEKDRELYPEAYDQGPEE